MAPIALVTGATGAVGPTLVSKLISNGYSVRTLSRAEKYSDSQSSDQTHFCGSITDHAVLDSALENVDVVARSRYMAHAKVSLSKKIFRRRQSPFMRGQSYRAKKLYKPFQILIRSYSVFHLSMVHVLKVHGNG
jgi:hypothetical protein